MEKNQITKIKRNNERKMRCPFEIGERVLCVETCWKPELYSVGKTYLVVVCRGKAYDNIGILDDRNMEIMVSWDKFISLRESRKMKLLKISRI